MDPGVYRPHISLGIIVESKYCMKDVSGVAQGKHSGVRLWRKSIFRAHISLVNVNCKYRKCCQKKESGEIQDDEKCVRLCSNSGKYM